MTMIETSYEPVYTASQKARIDRLPPTARLAFIDTLACLQNFEEIGGPEGNEYLDLMMAIIEEAWERHAYCRNYTMA
ncbi:hypothetical protein [Synechococcus sp. RedBA-s]|uniref:hypothetical protein n=1 Tax=Synechococcus sp. RedBA-s TaxID=2823741 RepID=UPI0020CD17A9|nr:hypothetical protein [Synechococcus sp. RedBA-s]MCP9801801.1 hypothetical protein [Synechococcus sp. RedBA-s]